EEAAIEAPADIIMDPLNCPSDITDDCNIIDFEEQDYEDSKQHSISIEDKVSLEDDGIKEVEFQVAEDQVHVQLTEQLYPIEFVNPKEVESPVLGLLSYLKVVAFVLPDAPRWIFLLLSHFKTQG